MISVVSRRLPLWTQTQLRRFLLTLHGQLEDSGCVRHPNLFGRLAPHVSDEEPIERVAVDDLIQRREFDLRCFLVGLEQQDNSVDRLGFREIDDCFVETVWGASDRRLSSQPVRTASLPDR